MGELPFSKKEYRDRLSRVYEGMDEKGYDALILQDPTNIYYLTGYYTSGFYTHQMLAIPRNEEPFFIVRQLEAMNVERVRELGPWVEKYITWSDDEDPLNVFAKTLREKGFAGKTVGFETDAWRCRMSAYEYARLRKLLPEVKFKDEGPAGKGIVDRLKLIKSKKEIEYIRKAAKMASNAMRSGIEAVAEGVNENMVAAEVWKSLLSAGSEFPHSLYAVAGPRSGLTHANWAGRVIQKGDVVFFEIGGCVKRYHGAVVRSASVGEPSKEIQKVAKLAEEGLTKAVEMCKPGVTSHEVDKACYENLVKAGLEKYRHRCGYSIGIDWGEGDIMSLRKGDPSVLKLGMVFHMPGITFMMPGKCAIGFSETVLITDGGHEVLTDVERKLFIK